MATAADSSTPVPPPEAEAAAAVEKIYTGADSYGCSLKDSVLSHLRSAYPHIELVDLGVDKYYSIAASVGRHVSSSLSPSSSRGLLFCGTGVGVAIFANKFPSVYASVCSSVADAVNTRSINDCNVLCLSGFSTSPPLAADILDAFLRTPFAAPCPASGNAPWPHDLSSFFRSSIPEMKQIPFGGGCAICCVRKGLRFDPVDIMPGAEMKIVRESPTSAIVRFAAGSVEPAHHHTFGHDVLVMKGRKKVWNLDKKEAYELNEGDYLFTPAGDVHRVKYFEDTEFFIRWDGDWDIFLDEDVEAAKVAIDKELSGNE